MPKSIEQMQQELEAYHGSPHRFQPSQKNPLGDFDPTKIGTGEGAQAYGYGHYLAENPGVANEYRRTLRDMNPSYDGVPVNDTVRKTAAELLMKAKGDKAAAIKDAQNYAFDNLLIPEINKMDASKVSYGSLYHVRIPHEHIEKMLDWDKPISQQNEAIQKVFPHFSAPEARALTLEGRQLRQQANDLFSAGKLEEAKSVMNRAVATEARMLGAMGRDEMTGQDLHGKIASLLGSSAKEIGPGAYDFGSKAISEMLHEMGVPGI